MDSQKQDRIYTIILRIWRQTVKSSQLAKIKDKETLFDEIQDLTRFLKQQYTDNTSDPQKVLIKSTLDNIHYMVRDILNYRAEIILNSARLHIKLDEKLLFPFEVEYYRNIFFAFRGFSGSKHSILDNIRMEVKDSKKNFIFSKFKKESVTKSDLSKEIIQENSNYSSDSISPESEFEMPEDDYEFPEELAENNNQENLLIQHNESDFVGEFSKSSSENDFIQEKNNTEDNNKESILNFHKQNSLDKSTSDEIDFDYIPIRILQPISSIVGADMQIYGPFEVEDVAYMPKKNALILQEENLVKIMTIGN